MTVAELIERLKKSDPRMRVLVDGYEDGYDDPSIVLRKVVDKQGPGDKTSWWSGRYGDADYSEGIPFTALVIGR